MPLLALAALDPASLCWVSAGPSLSALEPRPLPPLLSSASEATAAADSLREEALLSAALAAVALAARLLIDDDAALEPASDAAPAPPAPSSSSPFSPPMFSLSTNSCLSPEVMLSAMDLWLPELRVRTVDAVELERPRMEAERLSPSLVVFKIKVH